MRKLFTLIAAIFVAFAVNAATVQVAPGTNGIKNAVLAATAGDVIELSSGIYYEEGNFDFNKSLTIMAAEGAHPVVANRYYFRIEGGAQVLFQGIEFDGTLWLDSEGTPIGASDHCMRPYNNSTGTEIITAEGCKFHGYSKGYVFYIQRSSRKWHALITKDCIFTDNQRCIGALFESSGNSCDSLVVENCTFAGTTGNYAPVYVANGNTTKLSVDHCTFYNNAYHCINVGESVTNTAISNCIFANAETNSHYSATCLAGTIDHCLSYNTAGFYDGPTVTACITGDPLFVNASLGDLTLGEGSPALTAAADGSAIGDPRWFPTQGLPYMAILGEWNGYTGNELIPDSAELTASCTVHLDMNQNNGYGFKVQVGTVAYIINYVGGKYTFNRNRTSASGIEDVAGENTFWLEIDMEGYYTFTWTIAEKKLDISFPVMPTITVYFVNDRGWENVYAYAWDPQIVAWPGEPMTLTNTEFIFPIYAYELPINRQNIIFNDGNSGVGHQTPDLLVNAETPYCFKNLWYASTDDMPTSLQNVTDEPQAQKFIRDGKVLIRVNGETYTVLGTMVK